MVKTITKSFGNLLTGKGRYYSFVLYNFEVLLKDKKAEHVNSIFFISAKSGT